MEEVVSKLFKKSTHQSQKMDSIQFDDISGKTDTNIFELCNDKKLIEQEQLCQNLADQYAIDVPSLDQALLNSLYNSTNPRPLALYIHDDQSVATQIFNEVVLWSESLSAYLTEQFVLWEWNLTNENYYELLTIVATQAGEEVATILDSTPRDFYPLLVCLIFDRGQIKVECIIEGLMSDSEAFALLIQARDAFGSRFELPDTNGLSLTTIATENWAIPASTLTQISKESDEFKRVAADFDGGAPSIVRIDRIENTIWLFQYLNHKQTVDGRVGHDANEKLLFHGCPYAAAEQILQQGFDHQRIGRNGSLFGRGFYFSRLRSISDKYALPHPTTGEKRILMCRVLVGRSCRGNAMAITCPSNYDSTTDEANIHVVYSNRQVLPEYLITYK